MKNDNLKGVYLVKEPYLKKIDNNKFIKFDLFYENLELIHIFQYPFL